MKKILLQAIVAIGLMTAMPSQAQSVLDNLAFPAAVKVVAATGNSVNVREKPNTNGKKLCAINRGTTYAVLDENAQWYKVNTPAMFFETDQFLCGDGWVSKSVACETEAKPITAAMLNRFFGWSWSYDLWNEWMVSSPIGKRGLALLFNSCSEGTYLYLGKQMGNVFVFKYRVVFSIIESDDAAKRTLNTERFNDEIQYVLTLGMNYMKETAHGSTSFPSIDLTKFTDKMIESVFGNVIRENKTTYLYITADQLSGTYADYALD